MAKLSPMTAQAQLKQLEQIMADGVRPAAAGVIGQMVAVSGAQATVRFSDAALTADDDSDFSVGTYLGIRTPRSLVIGVLCDISFDAAQPMQASGRMDMLGEIVADASGKERFCRGVSYYPKVGSQIVRAGERELRLIFDVAGSSTIAIGHLQQDRSIGAYVDVEEMVKKHFAIFGSTGAGKSSRVALILREIMAARMDLRVLLIDPHNEYASCVEDKAHVLRPGNLRLPYWLFNFDETVEIIFGKRADLTDEIGLLSELIALAKNEHARTQAPPVAIA